MVQLTLSHPAGQKSDGFEIEFPEVTVVVLNYNGKKHIRECLDSIFGMDYPQFKVVVVDNASNDGSLDSVKRSYPKAKIVKYSRNHGFAKAYNMVLEKVESDFIVLLNNDVTVEPGWLRELMPYITDDNDVSAVTPKMLFMKNTGEINAAGGKCDIFGSGWNRGNGETDNGQYESVEEVFYANCGAIVIRKNAWKDVGSFDEEYFLYGEDLDWCWRARLKGYRIFYVPHSRIYHEWRASNGPMIPLLERNWLTTALKNYDSKTLMKLAPKLVALKTAVAAWLFVYGRNSNEKLAVVDGFLWNLKRFRDIWKKRLQIQASRKIDDREIQRYMYNGSLELSLGLRRIRHPITNNWVQYDS
jgi:GT2 family glycosyltransferase